MNPEPALFADKLHKEFAAVVAVNQLSLRVERGQIFGLLGPNGAGKTTTIRIWMDILKPDSGTALVLGQPPGAARTRVGYLPEERGLYRGLRVHECLTYFGQLKGMKQADAARRATELLERLELADRAKAKVQELSRGMQQKAQLAAALIHDPELVILDEPFQGLDPVNVEVIRTLIRELRAQGKTIVLSAHEMSLVESLCERIALINKGRIVLEGALTDIRRRFSPNALDISPPLDLAGWPEVEQAQTHVANGVTAQRVYLRPGVQHRDFLRAVVERGQPVERFELATMPLDEIFIRVVTGRGDEQ
ncbi:MAG: ATP-binding cassette domain-containing protein [Anaerolineales bacterium]|nr:ATP-binding cassette domain-containing protein [Anaerolineales bacterium]